MNVRDGGAHGWDSAWRELSLKSQLLVVVKLCTSDVLLYNTSQHKSALVITHSSSVDTAFTNAPLSVARPFPLQLKGP